MTHAVRDEQVRADDALPAFASAVAHEIRTPLAAVAGEVDLALCRDRSAAEYREALRRIGEGIADLVEITGDLTLVGAPIEPVETLAQLDAALADVRERYVRHVDVVVDAEGAAGLRVAADEARLARAITRVVEHALRHRRGGATVTLRVEQQRPGRVRLIVEAQPTGFWPDAWRSLSERADHPATPLRLRTARHIVDACGGSLCLSSNSGCDCVHIELPVACDV